jgi:manganese/zinc/iron transport system permease protein
MEEDAVAPVDLTMTAVATAVACALPGVFLVLRRQSLAGDAIGHVILLGIASGFLLGGSLHSPLVVLGAAAIGVLAVAIVESLARSRLVKSDAALGLVYPALFSVGVVLVSRMPKDVHFDVDAVLLGDLIHAPLRRFTWAGIDFGPWSMIIMTVTFVINSLFVVFMYKELKLTTFDPEHAKSLGIKPGYVHYALMTLVSLTVVAAFDAAGAVLVVAFLVAPAATAYLMTDRLSMMLLFSVIVAIFGATAGSGVADRLDANVAGAVAVVLGGMFVAAMLLSPSHGLIAAATRRLRLLDHFARGLLVVHLSHHEATPAAEEENRFERLGTHLNWPQAKVNRVLFGAERLGMVAREGPMIRLTHLGREWARELVG